MKTRTLDNKQTLTVWTDADGYVAALDGKEFAGDMGDLLPGETEDMVADRLEKELNEFLNNTAE